MFSEDVISHRLGELYPIGKKLMDVLVVFCVEHIAVRFSKIALHVACLVSAGNSIFHTDCSPLVQMQRDNNALVAVFPRGQQHNAAWLCVRLQNRNWVFDLIGELL